MEKIKLKKVIVLSHGGKMGRPPPGKLGMSKVERGHLLV